MAEYPKALYKDQYCPNCKTKMYWEETIHDGDVNYCYRCWIYVGIAVPVISSYDIEE